MHLELRNEPLLPDDALLVVHMGAGNLTPVSKAVFNAHDAWFPLRGHGLFALSVYAASPLDAVLSVMNHGQFGTASVGAIRSAGLEIIATNTIGVSV